MNLSLKTALSLVAGAAAALAATTASAKVDFSGHWVLTSDPMAAPAAASTPAAAKRVKELMEAKGIDAPNGSPDYARIWCTPEGMPWQHMHTLPIDVRQGPLTVSITYSIESDPRHIYIDGQPHPSPDVFDYTTVGHSIGRWQGDVLVTDTRYFKNGIAVIPGGGLRTEDSRLTERWRLVDHDTLRVTYTWTDAKTLRRPQTYTWTYKRAQEPVWMTEPQCYPARAMKAKGLRVPFDAPE